MCPRFHAIEGMIKDITRTDRAIIANVHLLEIAGLSSADFSLGGFTVFVGIHLRKQSFRVRSIGFRKSIC